MFATYPIILLVSECLSVCLPSGELWKTADCIWMSIVVVRESVEG